VLDRNGLRPSRYYVTKDDLVIMASEAGVLDIPPEDIVRKGRLQPGRMFLVDTAQGRIIEDEEIKREDRRAERPTAVAQRSTSSPQRPARGAEVRAGPRDAAPAPDRLRLHLRGRAHADHPDGARRRGGHRLDGQRRPLAVLSNKPRLLYDYFKQLFAQVTNPPIDCIREEIVTSPRPASAPRATCSTRSPTAAAASS
jgi:glutamate synthase (NADPH/NADH) large chain